MNRRHWLGACVLALGFLSQANGVQASISAGDLVIREFRLRGPASASDEYIVIHNRTSADITVASFDASAGFAVASSGGSVIFTVPEGTVIKAHGHYLGVNTNGFSLGVPYDASWTADVSDALGLALFDSSNPATFGSTATTIDAVGIGSSAAPYLEGTALPSVTAAGEYAWVRKAPAGSVPDTNSSAADFVLVATNGGSYSSVQSILGAPSPSNSANQDISSGLGIGLIEPSAAADASPNRVFLVSPSDRVELRRRITNNTGASVPALRLRVVEVSTFNSPGYATPTQADLRPMTSSTASIATTSIGVTSAAGLTLLTPPTQSSGGGWNSILTIPGGGLANGASVDVNIALAVARAGTETFSITVETVGTLPVGAPTMTPSAGTYAASQSVSLSSSTVGASIYYTTDGTTPTTSSTLYTGTPVSVAQSKTIKAFGVLANWADSPVSSAVYTLAASTPTIAPDGAVFLGTQSVTLASDTESPAEIWYTVDGSTPAASAPSILYTGAFNVSTPVVVKAAAFKTGWTASSVSSASFVPTVATPVFSPAPGTYTTSQTVTMTSTPGASIYYTTDGSTPTPSSTLYSAPVNLTETTTLKAAAFLVGWANSAVATGAFTLKVADPVLSPASGKWFTQRNISVTTATPGATMYYTMDGTEPTTSSTPVAAGSILVDRSMSLKVRAFKSGLVSSSTTRGRYAVTGDIKAGTAFMVALKSDKTVWVWGANASGQLGRGNTTTPQTTPIQVQGLTNIEAIAAGAGHVLALKSDGTLMAWGWNSSGQLGISNQTNQLSPVAVPGLSNVVAISAGDSFSMALLANGEVWTWGVNSGRQLADGTITMRTAPVKSNYSSNPAPVQIAAGPAFSLARYADGTVKATGSNFSGSLGNNSASDSSTPVSVLLPPGVTEVFTGRGDSAFATVVSGGTTQVFGWGSNSQGQMSIGSTVAVHRTPVLISNRKARVGVGANQMVIGGFGGGLASAGPGFTGELGVGANPPISLSRATPIPGAPEAEALTAGANFSAALSIDGTVWTWGAGANGATGQGTTANTYLVKQIPSFSLVANSAALADTDNDGLADGVEWDMGTDPESADTNGDGIDDAAALSLGEPVSSLDADGDGLTFAQELMMGTNPWAADTDGDGAADGVDIFPLDSSRSTTGTPNPNDHTPPVITLQKPVSATPIS